MTTYDCDGRVTFRFLISEIGSYVRVKRERRSTEIIYGDEDQLYAKYFLIQRLLYLQLNYYFDLMIDNKYFFLK
jgi:hypothetical protein